MFKILIDDSELSEISEIARRHLSFFEWSLAGMTLLQKLEKEHPKGKLFYKSENPAKQTFVLANNPNILPDDGKDYDMVVSSTPFLPWNLLQRVASLVEESLSFQKDWKKFRQKYKVKSGKYDIVGKDKNLYLHPSAVVYPQVVFDTSKGPIFIEENVRITPFSFLEGPLYVGNGTFLDNAKVGGGSLIGSECRLGGEIENSIVLDFTNKHHEGFLGHSFVGQWVNLGALATTSDLKNNYGIIKLRLKKEEVNTGTIKFGSWIGSFSKIAIGSMLNTGTVIDIGCNLVEDRISGYRSPFTWRTSEDTTYRLFDFIQDTKKIMARRRRNMSEPEEQYLNSIHRSITGFIT